MRDPIRNHVTHLLPAYVHRQLNRQRREQVARHVSACAECHAALRREESLARDLAALMPALGQPEPGQLRRLWPSILAEVRIDKPTPFRLAPSVGVILTMLLICAFSLSAFFSGTTHASAAPNPLVPSDIRATNTPVHTDEPGTEIILPAASQTASAFNLPMASPAPLAGRSYNYSSNP